MLTNTYNDRSYTIVIGECHGEYSLPDADARPNKGEGNFLRIVTIWDGHRIIDMLQGGIKSPLMPEGDAETIVAKFASQFPQEIRDSMIGDDGMGYVHELYGDYDALLWAFRTFAQTVLQGTGPSGDDDTFDYWPNAVEMLQTFARDLDTARRTDIHSKEIRAAYIDMLKRRGRRVMEFQWGGYDDDSVENEAGVPDDD